MSRETKKRTVSRSIDVPLVGPSVVRPGPLREVWTGLRNSFPPGSLCPPSTKDSTHLCRWLLGHNGKSLVPREPLALRDAPVASDTSQADARLQLARYDCRPTGTNRIDKLPTPPIRNKTKVPEPHKQPDRASHHYPGDELMPLFGVWILCSSWARINLFPPFPMATENKKDTNAPVDKIRFGGITASIYANEVKDSPIPLYKMTISRTYTQNGEYKTVTSFRWEDLPPLEYVVHKAWVRIEALKQEAWDASRTDSPKVAKESKAEKE